MFSARFSLIFVILIAILALRFFFYYQSVPTYVDGQQIKLQVVLQEEPIFLNQSQRFSVKNSLNQRFYIKSNLKDVYHYGDLLAIKGQLQVRKSVKGYTYYTLDYPQILVLQKQKNPLIEASLFIREKSSRLFYQVLPPVSADLLLGIVFGAKGDFPDSFYQKLQTTGVLHVIAASGMNVSFFTGAIMFSLGLFLKRHIAIILSIFAVIFYSFLVGFEASIIRASIMAIITFTASFFGRQAFGLLSLFMTGFFMLLWSPSFLFDVGFQLSFMATLGILLINPLFGRLDILGVLGEDIKTTISAQTATFPILLGTFGKVGILSLPVNILVLWTVPILMLLGSLGVLTGLIFEPLAKLILFLALPFLLFFEWIVRIFGEMGLIFSMQNFPWQFSVGYYMIVIALLRYRLIHYK